MSPSTKAVAFFGASSGCGLSALKKTLAAGHTCIALARTPAKLTDALPADKYPNLVVKAGNAHAVADVAACLVNPADPTRLVDVVSFSIGGLFNMSKMTIDDPDVCKKGMETVLAALATLRADGGAAGNPRILAVSTTGISAHGRDVPVLFLPMYHLMLKMPHADKKVMEEMLRTSSERWTLIRPSFLVDPEPSHAEPKTIRVGVEDLDRGVESKAVGYTISRDDVGRWIFENLIQAEGEQYVRKAASITW